MVRGEFIEFVKEKAGLVSVLGIFYLVMSNINTYAKVSTLAKWLGGFVVLISFIVTLGIAPEEADRRHILEWLFSIILVILWLYILGLYIAFWNKV